MATLQEYYQKDFSRLLSSQKDWELQNSIGESKIVAAKIHYDFDSNVFFISFFVPEITDSVDLFAFLLSKIDEVIKFKDETSISVKLPGEIESSTDTLNFSGKVFFYYDGIVDDNKFFNLQNEAKLKGLRIHYRDLNFSIERSKFETPLAFISHDSRDKEEIASKIATTLQTRMLPIWYDEYSLKLGDNLRESIEKGLKECKKCILILSPNFLENSGWTKTEFNAIFTRELIETNNLVLPIWAGVSKKEIYEYCPILVDRVGVNWDKGLDFVANKIQQALIQ